MQNSPCSSASPSQRIDWLFPALLLLAGLAGSACSSDDQASPRPVANASAGATSDTPGNTLVGQAGNANTNADSNAGGGQNAGRSDSGNGGSPNPGSSSLSGGSPSGGSSSPSGGSLSGGSPSGGSSSLNGGSPSGGSLGGGSPSGGAPVTGTVPTKQNLRVAFIGDSANGSELKSVLKLIKSENADMVIHEGDFDYSSKPDAFFATIDQELGASYPYFAAVGNHDAPAWSGYSEHLKAHLTANGVTLDDPDMLDQKYAFDYLGLAFVFVGENGKNTEFASYIDEQFSGDDHVWRLCNWHKNQKAMQIGGKSDEMSWGVYESCRKAGALIGTGHEHSYERTKTLSSFEKQTVDPACSDPKKLCVGPGRSFAFVSGLGGNSVRPQLRCLPETYPYGCNGEWAFIYSSNQKANYGALFIDFYVDGNPKKARGYFKNIDNQIVDQFEISKD